MKTTQKSEVTKKSVWEVLMDLKRSAAHTSFGFDRENPGYIVLKRAEAYLEYGSLVGPGFSTGGVK